MKDLPCLCPMLKTLVVVSVLVLAGASQPAHAQNTTVTFWPTSTVPSEPDSGADSAVELGLRFSSSQAGSVTGVQFYKSAANTGTHVGNLWSSSGKNLASVTFTAETASGWQQANFATPVAITAGTTYTISYHSTEGHYADSQEFFSSALSVPPLSAPVNAGVYKYGSRSGYPTSVWNASNYWVQPMVSIGPPALSALSVSPSSVVGGNSATGTVTLTGAAPTGGIVVTLQSSATTVPANVSVAAGATKATFSVITPVVTSSTAAVITASYNGASVTATLTETPAPTITVTISPTSASLLTSSTQQFNATVAGTTPTTVTWSTTGGKVSSSGLYSAPGTAGTYVVTATSTANTAYSASATVTVTAPAAAGSSTVLLGDQNVEAQAYAIPVGQAAAFQATAGASGTMQSVVVYLDPSSTATQLVAGVYADSGSGAPGTLLSQGTNAALVAGAWNSVIIPAASLTSGSPYWIALLGTGSGTALVTRTASGGCLGGISTASSLTALPASWVGAATTSCPLSAFGDSTQVIFFDNFPAGVAPSPYWVVLNRQGDYTNDELECYLPANVTQTGNGLVETAEVQTYTCGDNTHTPYTHKYTSGAVGWATLNYTYGTIEVKAEMAGGTGTWPALWLLGYECQVGWNLNAQSSSTCNWPAEGSQEIDIAELFSGNAGNTTAMYENLYGPYSDEGANTASLPFNATTGYHAYDLVWTSTSLTWYVDGVKYTHLSNGVPSTPMFLIIDLAVGGNGGGTPNNSTFPQSSTIQYVKVHY